MTFFTVRVPARGTSADIFMAFDALPMKGIGPFSGCVASGAIFFAGGNPDFLMAANALFMECLPAVQHGAVMAARLMAVAA